MPGQIPARPHSTEPMTETDDDALVAAGELAEVGRYPSLEQAHEHGLVILAMRQPCWVLPAAACGQFTLHAETNVAPDISRELAAYENEKQGAGEGRAPGFEGFRFTPGWGILALWVLLVAGGFVWQNLDPTLVTRAASSSTALVGRGEWWRPLTSLFLHADGAHLAGNLLGGLWFGTLAARLLGAWRAWALILVCGVLGNTLTSFVTWPEDFVSIGASTAVFGALGILAGLGFASMLRIGRHLPIARTAAPVLAGVILLGLMGGGQAGDSTDVLGHLFGFGCGLLAGVAIGLCRSCAADG
jgi:membrane associated rhomboid family serine protease